MSQSPPGPIEPGLQRLAIAAAMAMVRKEASALLAMRAVLRRHSEATDAALGRLRTEDPSGAAAEGSVILRSTSAQAETDLAAVVLAARTAARIEALGQLQKQLLAAGKALQRAGVPTSRNELSAPARGPNATDAAAADAAAKSLASVWLQRSVAGLLDWTRSGAQGVVPQIGTQTTRATDFRLRRTAATETAVAYNDEANEILQHVGDAIADAPAGTLLWKRWEAVLDRGVCSKCANFDNQVVRCNESFRGGEIPGAVHPNCRCVEVLALHQTDLNLAHAVAREMFGPGLGRAAGGGRDVFEDAHQWTAEERAEWMRRYAKAKEDPGYRARLLRFEVRRHEDSAAAGREIPSAIVPRLRASNVMARDRRSSRQIHDDIKFGIGDWRTRRDRTVRVASRLGEGLPTSQQAPWYTDGRVRPEGKLDETRRAFNVEERAIARYLIAQGNNVESVEEVHTIQKHKNADALVNGRRTEFKYAKPGASSNTLMHTVQDSIRGGAQARNLVIDLRGSGVSETEAHRTLRRLRPLTKGRVKHILMIGDAFEARSSDFV